jgi:predicted NUDIX family NTP pyrophosphohydrolase
MTPMRNSASSLRKCAGSTAPGSAARIRSPATCSSTSGSAVILENGGVPLTVLEQLDEWIARMRGSASRGFAPEACMPVTSAGLLLYRRRGTRLEVFLVHPGGPYWAKKDEGAWSVPKGLVDPDEDPLACARREFSEETGFAAPGGGSELDLGIFRQPSGKRLHIFAIEGDCDAAALRSNLFEMEWPPKSGRKAQFPEADRGGWFEPAQALAKIAGGQRPILEKLYAEMGGAAGIGCAGA